MDSGLEPQRVEHDPPAIDPSLLQHGDKIDIFDQIKLENHDICHTPSNPSPPLDGDPPKDLDFPATIDPRCYEDAVFSGDSEVHGLLVDSGIQYSM